MSPVDDSDGDEIRAAFAALETSVYAALPPKYFDELASNIIASVAALDSHEPLEHEGEPQHMTERQSMTQRMTDSHAAPAEREQEAQAKRMNESSDEDLGLDDIRKLAAVTKNRISKQMVAQAAEEEMLLSSSSAALRAVALPEPGKGAYFEAESSSVPKAAVSQAAMARAQDRSMPAWVYAFGGMAVAAAVVFLLMRNSDPVQVAQAPQAAMQPAGTDPAGMPSAPVQPSVAPIEAELPRSPASPSAEGGAQTQALGVPSDTQGAGSGEGNAPAVVASAESAKGSTEDTRAMRRRDSEAEEPGKPKEAPADKAAAKPAGQADAPAEADTDKAGAAPAAEAPAKKGDALEELLAEASGGVPAGGAAKPANTAPQRTSLDRSDIQKAMEAVKGKVQGCYEKHKQTGNVMISFSVEPSGQVSSAKATGSFAGTETGACVADAVQSARFPEFAGAKMSFTYPFLLTQ